MMNENNTGIENNNQVETDAAYEAAFAAELEAEQAGVEASTEVSADEAAILASDTTETTAEAKPEAKVKEKAPPAYLAFIAAVEAHARALGLSVKEQKSFFQFSASSGHKLYVEKAAKKDITRVDTSLPRTALVLNGKDLSLPLSKPNGRIACHVDPSIESVKQALEVLASYGDKIPAPKKPVAKDQAPA